MAVGLLVVLAGIAYGIAMLSGRLNTVELLRDRNDRIVTRLMERTRAQLDPAATQVEALRQRLQTGQIGIDDEGRLTDYMSAALDALPQVDAFGFLRNNAIATRVVRQNGRMVALHDDVRNYPDTAARAEASRRLFEMRNRPDLYDKPVYWGDLIWNPEIGLPLINAQAPVVVGGVFVGQALAVVSLVTLSRLIESDSVDNEAANFILYDDDYVLAHPTLLNHEYGLSMESPVPRLEKIHDPVLRQIWSGRVDRVLARAMLGDDGEAHIVEAEGRQWIFVYRRLTSYGERPWLVGRYFSFDEIDREIGRLQVAAGVGVISLLLSLLIAWRLGRLIRRPLLAIGAAANRLRNLDFDAPPLDRTRLRELDDAAQAINAANAALHWFGNYVPRKLVNRLVREGEDAINTTKNRDVTVIFTDLVGFTAMSEQLTAEETAEILNDHFALVTACIEAENGIVDKFIGDAVMAVWGAIKRDEGHATHACRAVLAIGKAVAADNARRAMLGKPLLRMRVGIHSGPVVVGNIGAPGRINYTVVGDTVNTAQRLEQLGRDHQRESEAFIALASAATVAAAGLEPAPPLVGVLPVKGRAGSVEVYRLDEP
jgi:adenylate cyclase